jgi:hypothetical protein
MNNIPECQNDGGSLVTFVFMNTAPVNEYDQQEFNLDLNRIKLDSQTTPT